MRTQEESTEIWVKHRRRRNLLNHLVKWLASAGDYITFLTLIFPSYKKKLLGLLLIFLLKYILLFQSFSGYKTADFQSKLNCISFKLCFSFAKVCLLAFSVWLTSFFFYLILTFVIYFQRAVIYSLSLWFAKLSCSIQ